MAKFPPPPTTADDTVYRDFVLWIARAIVADLRAAERTDQHGEAHSSDAGKGPSQTTRPAPEESRAAGHGGPRDQAARGSRGAVRRDPRPAHGAHRARALAKNARAETHEEVRQDDLPPRRRRDHRRAG